MLCICRTYCRIDNQATLCLNRRGGCSNKATFVILRLNFFFFFNVVLCPRFISLQKEKKEGKKDKDKDEKEEEAGKE